MALTDLSEVTHSLNISQKALEKKAALRNPKLFLKSGEFPAKMCVRFLPLEFKRQLVRRSETNEGRLKSELKRTK
jgi:hypothetical protein